MLRFLASCNSGYKSFPGTKKDTLGLSFRQPSGSTWDLSCCGFIFMIFRIRALIYNRRNRLRHKVRLLSKHSRAFLSLRRPRYSSLVALVMPRYVAIFEAAQPISYSASCDAWARIVCFGHCEERNTSESKDVQGSMLQSLPRVSNV